MSTTDKGRVTIYAVAPYLKENQIIRVSEIFHSTATFNGEKPCRLTWAPT